MDKNIKMILIKDFMYGRTTEYTFKDDSINQIHSHLSKNCKTLSIYHNCWNEILKFETELINRNKNFDKHYKLTNVEFDDVYYDQNYTAVAIARELCSESNWQVKVFEFDHFNLESEPIYYDVPVFEINCIEGETYERDSNRRIVHGSN